MENQIKKGTGLLTLPPDGRDYSKTKVFGATAISDLPTFDFVVSTPVKIKDQKQLDFCAGFASSEVSEDQEQIELDPLWQFAQIKRVIGSYSSYGADLRSAGKALIKYGSIPQKISPLTIASGTRDYLANWKNWPAHLNTDALPYRKKSMFFVDGPHDDFDNIRDALWLNRQKKESILCGVSWRDSWTYSKGGVIADTGWEHEPGDGHCLKIYGQKTINGEIYLIIQNSWGQSVGDSGSYYFPRAAVNREFAPYGQIFFSDLPADHAKYLNENGILITDNWIVGLGKAFFNFLKQIWTTIKIS